MQQCNSKKARLCKLIHICGVVLVVGIAYAVFCMVTGLGIPCVFNLITDWQCPGCGVSRMCLALIKGDLRSAWQYNPLILCLLPLGAVIGVDYSIRYVLYGTRNVRKWVNILCYILIAVTLAFGVIRNLPNL